ncbi:DUF490 domain-containing protein, partial [Ameyamaea chiangmaiensis]|nr:DUF490 domain-containing protein [Ameyamaea chiangmaiensis]
MNLTLDHPLLQVVGQARTAGALSAAIDVNAPDLAPLAAMGGTDLRGQAKLRTDLSMPQGAAGPAQLALDGTLAITGGLQQAVDLVGPDGRLSLRAHMTQDTATGATSATRHVTIQSLTFDGRKVHLTDDGTLVLGPGAPVVDDHATLSLPDLAAASTAVHGHAALELHASGPTDDLAADLHLDSVVGTPSVADGPLTLKVSAAHLPSRPQATLIASGILDRAPFDAALGVVQDADGARHLSIDRLSWNSLSGNGALVLPAGKVVPLGTLDLKIARLADFSRLAGQTLSGTLTAAVRTQEATPQTPAVVSIDLHGALGAPQARIRSLALTGHVSDPTGTPNLDLALKTDGLAVGTMAAGRASVTTRGTLAALAVQASADMTQLAGAPGNLRTDLTLDLPGHTVAIRTLSALAKGESIRLLAPATIAFGGQMGVDHLRATLGPVNVPPASIDIAGTVKPTLALTAHIGNLTPAIGKPFAPDLDAVGTIALNAQLAGTLAQPKGKADLVATGLRMRTGNAASIPPANIRATADLAGTSATVDARVDAGPKVGL